MYFIQLVFVMFSGDIPKLEVQWSPVHKNKFITWGPDIRVYEVINTTVSEGSKSSDTSKGFINYLYKIVYILYLCIQSIILKFL